MATDRSPDARKDGRSPASPQDQVLRNQACGQDVHGLGVRALIRELDGHQQIVRPRLRVMHLGDPVAVLVEGPGVEQLILRLVTVAAGVGVDQVLVGVRALRIVIAPPVPGVARDRVQVPPVFLDVLAMIALRAGQSEGTLLQYRILPVPQRQRQAQPLVDVGEPGQPVLAPPVGTGPRVVVRQVVPRVAVSAVVLPHRAPLSLADIRSPPVPLPGLQQPVLQAPEPRDPITFRTHHCSLVFSCALERRRSSQGPSKSVETASQSTAAAPGAARSRSRSIPIHFSTAPPRSISASAPVPNWTKAATPWAGAGRTGHRG